VRGHSCCSLRARPLPSPVALASAARVRAVRATRRLVPFLSVFAVPLRAASVLARRIAPPVSGFPVAPQVSGRGRAAGLAVAPRRGGAGWLPAPATVLVVPVFIRSLVWCYFLNTLTLISLRHCKWGLTARLSGKAPTAAIQVQ